MTNQEKLLKIKNLLIKGHQDKIYSKTFKVFGYQYNYYTKVFGSVNLFWFGPHEVIDYIIPLNSESNNENRPGTKKERILYVCVHDTASSAPSADALAHAKYVTNGGGGTSWHYSCGDTAIYHHVPDDEVAYHAGDGTKILYELIDTGVKASTYQPIIEIIDGYYVINGQKSNILAPDLTIVKTNDNRYAITSGGVVQRTIDQGEEGVVELKLSTKDINDQGLKTVIGENGNYHMMPTYYNNSYKYVANRLGNLYSIGIETMVNEGSNLLLTWHKCAKLCAHLIKNNNLTVDDVVPHHYFSGKPCPQTMRYNKMWTIFKQMVEIEYEILNLLCDDVEIVFECDVKNVEHGIINFELNQDEIKYNVWIKVGDLTEKIEFVSKYFM